MIIKTAIIKKLKGKYRLYSKTKGPDGKRKNLGTYDTLEAAKKREREIQFFKHHADDQAHDKETKMLGDLSDIAQYLEKAGLVDKAEIVYDVMGAIDGSLEQDIVDPYTIPDAQMNTSNQGHEGGESPIGGGSYSALNAAEGQPADDTQYNVDMIARSNGLRGNSVIDDQNAAMSSGFSDAYLYTQYGDLEGQFGPQ